jgi:hypothetical protein
MLADRNVMSGKSSASASKVRRAAGTVHAKQFAMIIEGANQAKSGPTVMRRPFGPAGSKADDGIADTTEWTLPSACAVAYHKTPQVPRAAGSKSRFHGLRRRLILGRTNSRNSVRLLALVNLSIRHRPHARYSPGEGIGTLLSGS